MKEKEVKKQVKMPEIVIKPSLEEYRGKVIFKTTFLKAKEALKNIKLPEAMGEKP